MIYTDFIYDFDGTIADSYPIFTEAFLQLLTEKNIVADYDHVMDLLKVSVQTAVDAFELNEDPKLFHTRFRDLRNQIMMIKGQPMEGVLELLAFVKEHGGRNYIYSHSPRYVWDWLKKWGMDQYFEGGVTADDGFPRKPAPDALNYICETYGIKKEKALMVGDRDIDIDAGHNADIKGVLLDPDGFYTDYIPDFQVTNLTEIKKIIL